MAFQKLNAFNEAFRGHLHDQINGIIIALAIETACQVGLRVGRRMKTVANWTAEPEVFFAGSPLKSQAIDNLINIDLVAQPS
jgi:hypothetical protein